eukprot:gene14652-19685_t
MESSKIDGSVEMWQSQSYWPLTGWGIPMGFSSQFTCSVLPIPPSNTDSVPENMSPPTGWEWTADWQVDKSDRYGQPDLEGWYLASTFERLGDQLKTCTGSGTYNKTSLVRKRRLQRPMKCVSPEIIEQIKSRSDRIMKIRICIESAIREKEEIVKKVEIYEDKRTIVFSQSLHLATQGTLNTLSILKDLLTKLRKIKQFFADRSAIEAEYGRKLEQLSKKILTIPPVITLNNTLPVKSPIPKEITDRNSLSNHSSEYILDKMTQNIMAAVNTVKPFVQHHTSHNNNLDNTNQNERISFSSPIGSADSSDSNTNSRNVLHGDASRILFSAISIGHELYANKVKDFSQTLQTSVGEELELLIDDVQSVLKDARTVFRKNSDICRLSDSAIKNCTAAIHNVHDSVTQQSLNDIYKLSDELNALKGANSGDFLRYKDTNGYNNNNNISLVPHEDLWLAIQRYRQCVRDGQEALCVLISESMDLELHQQILCNRVHSIHVLAAKTFLNEQSSFLSDISAMFNSLIKESTGNITMIGIPYLKLQSPFSRIQNEIEPFIFKNNNNNNNNNNNSNKDYNNDAILTNDAINSDDYNELLSKLGIFSFTTLYRETMPPCPGVVKSGYLSVATISDFKKSTASNALEDNNIWQHSYVIVTSDSYVHFLYRNVYDVPDRSFILKFCEIGFAQKPDTNYDIYDRIIEIRPLANKMAKTNLHRIRQGGMFIQSDSLESAIEWLNVLSEPYAQDTRVDESVETETFQAMLQSYPIIKGETAKIDLELSKYQQMIEENLTNDDSEVNPGPGNDDQNSQKLSPIPTFDSTEHHSNDHDNDHDNDHNSNEVEVKTRQVSTERRASISLQQQQQINDNDPLYDMLRKATEEYLDSDDEEINNKQKEDKDNEILHDNTINDMNESNKINNNNNNNNPKSYSKSYHTPVLNRADKNNNNNSVNKSNSQLKSIYGFGSMYKKESDSWIRSGDDNNNTNNNNSNNNFNNPYSGQKKLIPTVDKNVPLATKHSFMIKKYQEGLEKEKERSGMKVLETRDVTLKQYFATNNDDNPNNNGENDVNNSTNNDTEFLPLVKRLSSKFVSASGVGNVSNTPINNKTIIDESILSP